MHGWRSIALAGCAAGFLFAVADGGGAGVALAQEGDSHSIDRQLDACMERDPSTHGMIRCASRAERAWDEELNRAYQWLMDDLSTNGRSRLKAAQRAWIAMRDKEFAFIAELGQSMQGTMWGPVLADRRARFVKARVLELESYRSLLEQAR